MNTSPVLLALGIAVSVLLVLAVGISLAWHFYYIDDRVTVATKYGFSIGMSKEEVYAAVAARYPKAQITGTPQEGVLPRRYETSNAEELLALQQWDLSFGRTVNLVRLKFANDELVEIYRHRMLFEIP